MTMPQPPKGDPTFTIDAPTNNSIVGPDFSVNGWGPPNMTNIVASVGGTSESSTQHPNSCWEAIFSGMASGTYGVSATSSAGNATPGGITVTVDADPGVTIGPPAPPGPSMGADADPPNPWTGWTVGGTYDRTKVKEVWLYLTQRGANVQVGVGQKAWGKADLGANGKDWSCGLGFVPPGYRGNGFLIHYNAHLLNGQIVHGSLTSSFNGPPAGS